MKDKMLLKKSAHPNQAFILMSEKHLEIIFKNEWKLGVSVNHCVVSVQSGKSQLKASVLHNI